MPRKWPDTLWLADDGKYYTSDGKQFVPKPTAPEISGKRKHGYNSWVSMLQRCYNPNQTSYSRYGGSGHQSL
jgi:hypothetical protein